MASNNIAQIRKHIQGFAFKDLFIDELGWDQYRDQLRIVVEDQDFFLNAFAEKRGLVAFHYGDIPEYRLRRKIEQQVAKTHRENIIIYTEPNETQQVWQWVRREPGRPLANRERQFHRGQSGENIAQVLANIAFSLDEEDTLTIVDVTSRIRAAFDVEQVTRRFYDRFKRQHDAFLRFIEGIPDDDLQRWYASVMLNRLMFIYFVQKKYFLDNDPDYLRNRLAQTDGNFYQDFLCPLFFEGFAKKEHPAHIRALLGDVPYLNGGLFLRHQIEEQYGTAIQIADSAFERLFDFFDEYRWHLDERPLRDDNEINPDVLGYIFEKYINQKQMGAYYTKEDITEYISKNTVIPFLFDEARKAVRIAFEGEHTIWDLLVEAPDRYIYPAVRHGVEYELPENIAVGLDDVSQRADWNTPAPSDYGLPTEIWREVVARRTRYAEVREKLINGDVRQINDLITYNLDIQQFAQDVIDYTDSPDVVRAFWKAINNLTVLDPTAGSGAFLFAALNILEPLYEACVERMEGFVAELDRTGDRHPQTFSDFRDVLARIEQHPNRRYFILKSIIVNNLFGVDIMEEAVEICKLRLFLKLVAQVDDKQKIEPLPDIDFNIRAGNTLVGFATQDEVNRAMTSTAGGQGKLLFGEDQATLDEIDRKASDIDRLFGLFRQQQTELGGEVRPEDKQELNRRLLMLQTELNILLARQHNVDVGDKIDFKHWLKSNQPFHWFVEFHSVLKTGGFDVIIGNPPYTQVPKNLSRTILYSTYKSALERWSRDENLYTFVVERSFTLLNKEGKFGMILPLSITFSTKRTFDNLRTFIADTGFQFHWSHFDRIPSALFGNEVRTRCTIVICSTSRKDAPYHATTPLLRWSADARQQLFEVLGYNFVAIEIPKGFPKVASQIQADTLEKLHAINKPLALDLTDSIPFSHLETMAPHFPQPCVYVGGTAYNWFPAWREIPETIDINGNPSLPARTAAYKFPSDEEADVVFALLCSSLGYWWWAVSSDGFNLKKWLLARFPVSTQMLSSDAKHEIAKLGKQLRKNLKEHYVFKDNRGKIGNFYLPACSDDIEQIDDALAHHVEGLSKAFFEDIASFNMTFSRASTNDIDDDEEDDE